MHLAFIGLGRMGAPMAANLLSAGHRVTVYNRTPSPEILQTLPGAHVATSVAEACAGATHIFTMLADDAAMEAVAFGPGGLVASLAPGAVHVACSTLSGALINRLEAAHLTAGQQLVAAPVIGRPPAAAARQLAILAAGPPDAMLRTLPLLEAMGRKVFVLSEAPRAASLVKLGVNFLTASAIEAMGEAMALVGKGGVDRERFLEVLTTTLFDSPIYKIYGALIATQSFSPPGMRAALGRKDIKLVLEEAEALDVPMPLAGLLRDRSTRLIAQGGEDLDWAAITGLALQDAGLASWTSPVEAAPPDAPHPPARACWPLADFS